MAASDVDADIERQVIEARARRYLLGPCNHTGTGYSNDQTRNVIQNCAEVICLNGTSSPYTIQLIPHA